MSRSSIEWAADPVARVAAPRQIPQPIWKKERQDMSYLTQEKLVILGAAGAIGSNMMQTALTMQLTPRVCGYDPFAAGMEGTAEEIYHCAFPGAAATWTTDIAEALRDADYVVSSGGAPRKEGMTREDLLKGNAEIAAQLGQDIKRILSQGQTGDGDLQSSRYHRADRSGAFRLGLRTSRYVGCLG